MAFDFPSSPTVGQQFTPVAGTTYVWNGQGWVLASSLPVTAGAAPPQGRLTLQSGTPVMTTTQAAKTTIYYTPYHGNLVPIYDGTNFSMSVFSELSVLTTDTTKSPAAIGASKVNDWFVWNDAGTVRIGHGPDWTSDTVRSAGTALVMVNGILLNNVAITNGPAASRGTYVGTTRSNASSQLDWIFGGLAVAGSPGFFGVWNAYNRVTVTSIASDSNATTAFGNVALAVVNAGVKHSFICGLAEDAFDFSHNAIVAASTSSFAVVCIGYDSLTVKSGTSAYAYANNQPVTALARYSTAALGFHFGCELTATPGGGAPLIWGNGVNAAIGTGLWFTGRM